MRKALLFLFFVLLVPASEAAPRYKKPLFALDISTSRGVSGSYVSFTSGTATPTPPCTTGSSYLETDANKFWVCTSTDTWTDATIAGSGSPAGLDTYVQYNNALAFGAEAAFAYNQATNTLTVGALSLTTDITFAQITPATAGSKLFGRGDSGAGDIQEISLGANLTMTGTTLAATGGGGTPAAPDTSVQWNNAGAFGGEAAFFYTAGSNLLTVDNLDLDDGTFAAPSVLFSSGEGIYRSAIFGSVAVKPDIFAVMRSDDGATNYEGLSLHAAGGSARFFAQTGGTGTDDVSVVLGAAGTAGNVSFIPGASGLTILNYEATTTANAMAATKTGSFVFYGSNDAFETTLSAVDATADATFRLPAFTAGTYDVLALSANGFAARTGSGTQAARSIAAGTGVSVANGDGVSGNPTVSVDTATTPQYSSGTASPPATCNVGEVYAETDQLRACTCSATNTWTCNGKLRNHATDCTSLTDGLVNEMCFEADANTLYVCEPSAGNCDTAGEWTAVGGGSGAPTDAKYIVAEANGSLSAEVAPSGDDQVPVSDSSSAATWRTVPNCTDSGGNHLNYTQSSNSFSCGTTSSVSDSGYSYASNANQNQPGAGATVYLGIDGAVTSDPEDRAWPVVTACTVRRLYFRTLTAQPGTGTLVVTIRNYTTSSDTSVTLTVSAGAAKGVFSDTSNSASVSAGDWVTVKVVNNASSASAAIGGWGFQCN